MNVPSKNSKKFGGRIGWRESGGLLFEFIFKRFKISLKLGRVFIPLTIFHQLDILLHHLNSFTIPAILFHYGYKMIVINRVVRIQRKRLLDRFSSGLEISHGVKIEAPGM